MLKRVLIWVVERVAELILASYLLLVVLGSSNNPRWTGATGDIVLMRRMYYFSLSHRGIYFPLSGSALCASGKEPSLLR